MAAMVLSCTALYSLCRCACSSAGRSWKRAVLSCHNLLHDWTVWLDARLPGSTYM